MMPRQSHAGLFQDSCDEHETSKQRTGSHVHDVADGRKVPLFGKGRSVSVTTGSSAAAQVGEDRSALVGSPTLPGTSSNNQGRNSSGSLHELTAAGSVVDFNNKTSAELTLKEERVDTGTQSRSRSSGELVSAHSSSPSDEAPRLISSGQLHYPSQDTERKTRNGKDNDEDEAPLLCLQNVTQQSRSLIPSELWQKRTMTSSEQKSSKRSLRKRLVSSLKPSKRDKGDGGTGPEEPGKGLLRSSSIENPRSGSMNFEEEHRDRRSSESTPSDAPKKSKRRGEGFVRRMRSLSRSRSRSSLKSSDEGGDHPKTIVTVTSCRSDGYYNQKAPGSTSKLPRKAPTNLKLFHELAVGIKDAYAAVGQTPVKPVMVNEETGQSMSESEFNARNVLWEFIGNIDFVSGFWLPIKLRMPRESRLMCPVRSHDMFP